MFQQCIIVLAIRNCLRMRIDTALLYSIDCRQQRWQFLLDSSFDAMHAHKHMKWHLIYSYFPEPFEWSYSCSEHCTSQFISICSEGQRKTNSIRRMAEQRRKTKIDETKTNKKKNTKRAVNRRMMPLPMYSNTYRSMLGRTFTSTTRMHALTDTHTNKHKFRIEYWMRKLYTPHRRPVGHSELFAQQLYSMLSTKFLFDCHFK